MGIGNHLGFALELAEVEDPWGKPMKNPTNDEHKPGVLTQSDIFFWLDGWIYVSLVVYLIYLKKNSNGGVPFSKSGLGLIVIVEL